MIRSTASKTDQDRLEAPSRRVVPRRTLGLAPPLLTLSLLLGVLAAPSPAAADTLRLTNGNELEGEVISDGDPVVIRLTTGARAQIPRSRVVEIVRGPTRRQQLAEREADLDNGDVEALHRLARWCDENELEQDATRLYWRVLELDPDRKQARERLGFRKLGAIWLTEEDWQRAHGRVLYRDQWMSLEEWEIAARRDENEARLQEARRLLREAAGKSETAARQEALREFRELPRPVQRWALHKGLDSLRARERQFTVREFGQLADPRDTRLLAHTAVTDSRRSVRDEALRVLQDRQDPDVVLSFIPYLDSDNARFRVNSARALNVFPDQRAVGALITTVKKMWGDFGRSHVAIITQRSFVKDYELVSGGTGLVVQEVADPVIDTFQTGVVLDVDVKRAEAVARIATLEKITGQAFGADFGKWQSWWKNEAGKERALGQKEPPAKPAPAPKEPQSG